MVNEMSLRLEKLVEDIKEETILWPIEDAKNSAEEEAAWARIGVKHKMTGPHVKSIFKVLSKKYEVEKANPNTEWKLFSYLSFLDKKKEENVVDTDFDGDDGEEFVELLEVNEDYCSDDEEPNTSGESTSENSTKNTSAEHNAIPQMLQDVQARKIKNDRVNTDKKDSKNGTIKRGSTENGIKTTTSTTATQIKTSEQTLRKSSSPVPRKVVRIPMALSKNSNTSIQEKEKKTQSTLTSGLKLALKKEEKSKQALPNLKEVKLKRKNDIKTNDKDDDELNSPPIKRQIVLPRGIRVIPASAKSTTKITSSTVQNETQSQSQQSASNVISANSSFMPISPTDKLPPFSSLFKKSPTSASKEAENKISSQIKIQNQKQENEQEKRIASPQQLLTTTIKTEISSPPEHLAANNIASNNKINGIDTIRKDYADKGEAKLEIEQICKDADENTEIKVKVLTEQAEKILPTFFRDLYNSKKYDSFGMYVSSTMNRLPTHLASKLEAKILQSIIEVNAMIDERMEEM